MSDFRENFVANHFRASCETLDRAAADTELGAVILAIADTITGALRQSGKLLIAGNGGSAADAQHIAAEFVGRFVSDRAPLAAIALSTDTSALTSIGNDYGFEHVFERQVRAIGRKGDVFLAISTSGRSPNVLAALKAARELGLTTVGFTKAADTPMRALCDITLAVPSEETALVQQVHITAAHAICQLVERALFGAAKRG